MSQIEITSLTIYPVKSMQGIPLDQATLTPQGLAHDRRFMVVGEDGRFVTQRGLPALALIGTTLDDEAITLSRDGHGSTRLPLKPQEGQPVSAQVWGDNCVTVDQGEEISRWLTAAVGSRQILRLVRMAPGFIRPQGKPEQLGKDTHTHFADSAPFLVAARSSLEALNAELERRGQQAVPMNRFRPNVVVAGLEPFGEHSTAGLANAACAFRFCHPCQRCVVTTIDQDTGVPHPDWQPYKTLRDINPMPGKEQAPAFGQNAVITRGEGARIAVGDRLEVVT